MKVALYLRVSSLHQDYERQRVELINFCKYRGFEIVKVFEEKISGYKDERPEFKALCNLTKEEVDGIVVWEISRLGRKLTTMLKAIEDFTIKEISVITKKEGFQTLTEDGKEDPATKLVLAVCGTMAEMERETLIERTHTGTVVAMNKNEIAYTSNAPFGYKKEDKKLAINEEEAEVVRNLYRDYINGNSMMQLSNIYGIDSVQIGRILKNPVYMGKPFSNLLNKQMEAPIIISEEEWYKVEEIRAKRRKERSKVGSVQTPLRGIMTCSCCGKKLVYNGKGWSCKKQDVFVGTPVMDKLTEKLTETIREDNKNSQDMKTLQERAKSVRNSLKTAILNYSSLVTSYEALEAKIKLLSTQFTIDDLKSEMKELKSLQSKMNKANQDVIKLGEEEKRIKEAIDTDYTQVQWQDVVEGMTVTRNDRSTTTIDIQTKTGITYRAVNYSYKRILTIDKV